MLPYVEACVFDGTAVTVSANPVLAKATAEGTVAMIAAGAYRLPHYARLVQQGGWSENDEESVPGLSGQKIGLIGLGAVCREVIRLLQPYGAEILLYSEHCSQEEGNRLGVQLCSLETLLKESRIISVHSTLTPRTRGMLGEKELALLGDGALLVNTARAAIIEEKALIRELQSGRIEAVFDVFEKEPLPLDHPFRSLPNVSMFPHVAAFSSYWKRQLGRFVIEDLERFLRGEIPLGLVSREQYARMTREETS